MKALIAYYRFEMLSEELKAANKIKSQYRFDCTAHVTPGQYNPMAVYANKKGMLAFYQTETQNMVDAEGKRMAAYVLSNGKQNISSLFFDRLDLNTHCYGHPNGRALLSDGTPNPALPYQFDAFLFLCDWQQRVIEVLAIQGGKPLNDAYYNHFVDGGFDDELARLRLVAVPYYAYKVLSDV
jgi:hypothetical protein